MVLNIHLSHDNYDPFIDYMKGMCIIAVIMQHAIYIPGFEFTIKQQVPLFLLIQTFHSYKHGVDNCKTVNINKLWVRVLRPFLILQLAIIIPYCLLASNMSTDFIYCFLKGGGIGPGSYYPWIYIQFVILLPLIAKLFSKYNMLCIGILMIAISTGCELLFAIFDFSDEIWRIICFRYLFLMYLGFIWVQHGLKMSICRLCLVILSIIFICLFSYTSLNMSPLFYESGWKQHHWICYFFVAFGIPHILWLLYNLSIRDINKVVILLGQYSYHIYLLQMFVFTLIPKKLFCEHLGDVGGAIAYLITVFALSVIPVLLFYGIKKKYAIRLQ